MNQRQQDERNKLVEKVVKQIQEGKPFWWDRGHNQKVINGATNIPYRGGNIIRLSVEAMARGYQDPRWVTFKQASDNGWKIKKGEHGVKIEVYQMYTGNKAQDTKDKADTKEGGLKAEGPVLEKGRTYRVSMPTVFNAEQVEGMPPLPELSKEHQEEIRKGQIAAMDTIIAHSEAPIHHDQLVRNYYQPGDDTIHVMAKEKFHQVDSYYATVLHEIGHSTGHASRLNRNLTGTFGSPDYAKEELRAELTSMFLSQEFNTRFDETHFQNHAAYLQSWAKALQDDPNELFRAASDADRAVSYIKENMLEKYLDKEKAHEQEDVKVFQLDPIAEMDDKALASFAKEVLNAQDQEFWEALKLGVPEKAMDYAKQGMPADWRAFRESTVFKDLMARKDGNPKIVDDLQEAYFTQVRDTETAYLKQVQEAYPIREDQPYYVHLEWSEQLILPRDGAQDKGIDLSVAAAEHLFKRADAQRTIENELSGYAYTYGKTQFNIMDTQTKEMVLTERMDMGDRDGGLVAFIKERPSELYQTVGKALEKDEARQRENPARPVELGPVPALDTPPRFRDTVWKLAKEDWPLPVHPKEDQPYIQVSSSVSAAVPAGDTISLNAADQVLTYRNMIGKHDEFKANWKNMPASAPQDVSYALKMNGETMAEGRYETGREPLRFIETAEQQAPGFTAFMEAEYLKQKRFKAQEQAAGRPKHNISRSIEIRPKRRRKAVTRRRSASERGTSR